MESALIETIRAFKKISANKDDTKCVIIEKKRDIYLYKFTFRKKTVSDALLLFSFNFSLDHAKLLDSYKSLPRSNALNINFIENTESMKAFIEDKIILIISNLKEYNEVEDNYDEIAKLLDSSRGVVIGKDLGII